MLLVQKFLENHTFGDLVREHGVYCSFSKSGHKFSLNYDQIEAKDSDLLAQECRGLILACEDNKSLLCEAKLVNNKLSYNHIVPGSTKILAFAFKRFFNYGQESCANVNWNDPKLSIFTKLDGTLSITYCDSFTNKWCMATRSVPEADIIMDNGIFTFRTLFEKAVQDTCNCSFDEFTTLLDKNYTYCFELTTPYNRIVVSYPNNTITLLAARDLRTLKEVDFNHPIIKNLNVPHAHTYAPMSVNELVTWVSTLNPMSNEGIVVCDSNFNRVKIKNAGYIAYNRLYGSLSSSIRNCMEIILLEKDDDVISFLPEEISKNLIKLKNGLQIAIKNHDDAYLEAKAKVDTINPGDKKTFALLINNKNLWTAPLFQMYSGKVNSIKEFIASNKKDGTWNNSFLDNMVDLANKALMK